MALALNLRGDLAKLSDAELADRLETAWKDFNAAEKPSAWSIWPASIWARRGPIRHPRVYRFVLGLGSGSSTGHWLDWLAPILASTRTFGSWIPKTSADGAHLTMCEIRDIMDEIQRRVDARKASAR